MALPFPHKIKTVTKEEDTLIKKYYKDYVRPFVRVGAAGYLATPGYADHAQDIYNLQVKPDDVWVTSFSRSGTTWLQELVWLVANDYNFEEAKSKPLFSRYTFLEYPTQDAEISKAPMSSSKKATVDDFRTLPDLPSPRFVKSHLPLSLLPPALLDTAKVLYIARDARDVAVSFHFAHKLFRYFDDDVTFKEFWDLFKEDLILHTPMFSHVNEAWERRAHPNLLFLFYEDMQKDLPAAIDKVASFLGKECSAEQRQNLVEYLSFDNMKKTDFSKDNNEDNRFFRKGRSGGWVQYFNEDMKKEADEYIAHNLSKTDIRYPEPN